MNTKTIKECRKIDKLTIEFYKNKGLKQKEYRGVKNFAIKNNLTYKQAEYCISKAEMACDYIILGRDIN